MIMVFSDQWQDHCKAIKLSLLSKFDDALMQY